MAVAVAGAGGADGLMATPWSPAPEEMRHGIRRYRASPFYTGLTLGMIVSGVVILVLTSMVWIRILERRGAF